MSEQDAIDRLKQGDIGGLETLVGKYQLQAIRAADIITRDRGLSEDIVQEAFVRVYERIHQFDARRPFGPWFLRIVVNDALKAVSKNKRSLPLENLREDRLKFLFSKAALLPEEWVQGQERREWVWDALGKLAPEQRAVIVLKYFLNLSIEEISVEVLSPSGTVKWRLHRARERLRGLLKHLNRNENKPKRAQDKNYNQGKDEGISKRQGTTKEVDGHL
jgi:RNA polymerase sigma-70 factor (ECF subfamily)